MLPRLTTHLNQLPKLRKSLQNLKRIKRQRRSRRTKLVTQKTMRMRKAITKAQVMRPATALKKHQSIGTSRDGAATT